MNFQPIRTFVAKFTVIVTLHYFLFVPAQAADLDLDLLASRLEFGGDIVEIVWLGEGSARALALFEAPSKSPEQGVVIVMLGVGQILERSEFSTSVRQTLSNAGWGVLIVQTDKMLAGPSEPMDTDSAVSLMSQAKAHISSLGYTKIVVVAHGKIAQQLWPALQAAPENTLGFVGIDEWIVDDFVPPIPVLNVVNTSLKVATTLAEKRFSEVKKRPSAPCETYFYDGPAGSDLGYGVLISRRIRGWVERHFNDKSAG